MLLVLNCFANDQYADDFDKTFSKQLNKTTNLKYKIKRVSQIKDLQNLSLYTHLIISGSETSTLDDNLWDKMLNDVILYFITHRKAILGICYGHQFLAKTLVGKKCLRKAQKPEIGWIKIDILNSKLFENIDEPVSFVLHYDEVSYLTEDFNIIASTKACAIHGFQYKDLPVWGVQFHPEYNLEQSKEIIKHFSEIEPDFHNYFISDLEEEDKLKQIEFIILNFLKYKV